MKTELILKQIPRLNPVKGSNHLVMAVAAAALGMLAVNASAYTGEQLAGKAKVTIEKARAIALKAHPGQISDEELELEKGGGGLRYSFDIRDGKGTQEVGVDARTGAVLENAREGPHPD